MSRTSGQTRRRGVEDRILSYLALGVSVVAVVTSIILSPQGQHYLFDVKGEIDGRAAFAIDGPKVDLSGTVERIEPDHAAWLLVKPVDDLNHYAVPVQRDESQWSANVFLGEDRRTPGAEFWVYLYDVDSLGNVLLQEATAHDIPTVATLPTNMDLLDSVLITREQ